MWRYGWRAHWQAVNSFPWRHVCLLRELSHMHPLPQPCWRVSGSTIGSGPTAAGGSAATPASIPTVAPPAVPPQSVSSGGISGARPSAGGSTEAGSDSSSGSSALVRYMEAEAALRQERDAAVAHASYVERENVALREKVCPLRSVQCPRVNPTNLWKGLVGVCMWVRGDEGCSVLVVDVVVLLLPALWK